MFHASSRNTLFENLTSIIGPLYFRTNSCTTVMLLDGKNIFHPVTNKKIIESTINFIFPGLMIIYSVTNQTELLHSASIFLSFVMSNSSLPLLSYYIEYSVLFDVLYMLVFCTGFYWLLVEHFKTLKYVRGHNVTALFGCHRNSCQSMKFLASFIV